MVSGIVLLMLALLIPWQAWCQPPAFTFVAPLDPQADGRRVSLDALAGDGTLAGNTAGTGPLKPLSYRLAPGTYAPTAITCPESDFLASPFASRGGPIINGMNDAYDAVGAHEHVSRMSYGIISRADGRCIAYLHPGSVGTIFTGVNNSTDPIPLVAGRYWNAANLPTEPGLLRFHNFFMTSGGGVTLIDGPTANDRNIVMGGNTPGQIIGWAQISIQANNDYVYRGFLRQADGTLVYLTTPTGGEICPRAINDSGIGVATAGRCEATGGTAYWFDTAALDVTATPPLAMHELPFPPVTEGTVTHLKPTTISTGGAIAGSYGVRIATGLPRPNDFRNEVHGFLAIPQAPPPPAPPKKTQWWQWWKKTRLVLFEHWEDVRDQLEAREDSTGWRFALDDDGKTAVLVGPGGRIFGKETP